MTDGLRQVQNVWGRSNDWCRFNPAHAPHEFVERDQFGARVLANVVKVVRADAVFRAVPSRTDRTRNDWAVFFIVQFFLDLRDSSARANMVLRPNAASD